MNEFIVSTKGSLWECSCPECQNKGERKGSRKGLRYDWDGVPFEEIEFRLDSPVIDEDIYSMSDEELLQFAEDHGLRPEMFTNELPDWAQRDGSRKGSRKGASINTLSRDERQQLYNMIDAKLKSEGKPWDYVYTVTGKDYEGPAYEAFANMPENKDMVNGLILEITNSRQG